MKIQIIIPTIFLVLFNLYAEGIPKDKNGNITVQHTDIEISQSQIDEIQFLGTLTLTEHQLDSLRIIGKCVPKRVNVISIDCDFCENEEPIVGIRISDNKIAFINKAIKMDTDQYIEMTVEREALLLRVDNRGQFYVDGILIPFNQLLNHFQKWLDLKGIKATQRVVILYLPFAVTQESPTVKDRLTKLQTAAIKNRWRFNISK